jgi:predicted Zn-dependent protease
MSSFSAEPAPLAARRVRWRPVVAIVIGMIGLLGIVSWGWIRDRLEIRTAVQLVEDKQFDVALPILLRLDPRYPRNVAITRALALGYLYNTRELAETGRYLDRWCEIQPEDAEPFRFRMRFWLMQEMVSPAISDAQRVLELQPGESDTRAKLVELLLTAGRYEEAEKEGLRCYRESPGYVELWFVLANIYHGLGQRPGGGDACAKAAGLVDQVLHQLPDHVGALKLRAKLYLEAGQPDLAIQLLKRRVIGTSSKDPTLGLYELSEALTRAGRLAEAKETMNELEWRQLLGLWSIDDHRDDNLGLQKKVVEAMLAAGKTEEAVRFLIGILERKPYAPAVTHDLLASSYEKQGQLELARNQHRLAQRRQEEENGRKDDNQKGKL